MEASMAALERCHGEEGSSSVRPRAPYSIPSGDGAVWADASPFIAAACNASMILNAEAPPFEYHALHPPPAAACYSYSYCYQAPSPLWQPYYGYYPQPLAMPFSHLSLVGAAPEAVTGGAQERAQRPTVKRSPLIIPMEFDESKLGSEIRTTIMIKNVPNKLSRDLLIILLDQHCAEENQRAATEGSTLSEYDFIYLPMDFENKCNLGYAFVNFTTALAGWRLHRAMHGRKWAIFCSNKTSHVCYARIQGKEALTDNFRGSCFVCHEGKYLPAVFSPPRNGTTSLTPPAAVGRRARLHR